MKRFGTDVLALACIAGAAGLGVAATLAFADGSDSERTASGDCAVELQRNVSRIVIASAGEASRTVVVSPDVHVDGDVACGTSGESLNVREIRIRGAREARERARVEVERARERLEQVRVEIRGLEGLEHLEELEQLEQLEDFDFDFDFEFDMEDVDFEVEELDGKLEIEIEERLEEAMRRLEERLSRLDGEVGT